MNQKTSRNIYILIGVLFICIVLNTALVLSFIANNPKKTTSNNKVISQQASIKVESDVTKLVSQVNESVVTIALHDNDSQLLGNGSGSIISNEGGLLNIVTNNHVVDMDSIKEIKVIFANGEHAIAEVLGRDAISDLALLEAKADFDVKALPIGDSDALQVGEAIIAIGSPLDIAYTGTVTDGIISGLNRSIKIDTAGNGIDDYAMNVIQTNASINPGNSGGPLINMAGQMIGINTIKIAQTGFEGMGFAIPSNDATTILNQLKENGEVKRPLLGISYQPISSIPSYAYEKRGIPSDISNGLYIIEVLKDSAASKGGLKDNDIITRINDNEITDLTVFTKILYNSQIGDKLILTVIRDGNEIEIEITL